VTAPHLLTVQLKYEIVGSIVDSVDLFEYYLALEIEIALPEKRIENEISKNIGSNGHVLV
jgi:hypothetical protein